MNKLLGFLKVGEQRKKRCVTLKYKVSYTPILSTLYRHGFIYSVSKSGSSINIFLKVSGAADTKIFSRLADKIKRAKQGHTVYDQPFVRFYNELRKVRCQLR